MTMPRLRIPGVRGLLFVLLLGASLPTGAIFLPMASVAQSRAGDGLFDPAEVVKGIVISRRACAELERQETGLWVEVGGEGACLRYYAAGLRDAPGPNPVAAAWLNGDVLGPKGDNAERRQKGIGPATMIEQVRRLSKAYGVPFIFLARPGTYGSAGKHHALRGLPQEAKLVHALLDGLSVRYGIKSWSLGGHSGGGTLVAEMLARRKDIRCAVLSSAAAAHRAYLEARGLIPSGAPLRRFDPYTSLDALPDDPRRRIFAIGDPREANVPFSTQRLYFEGLRRRGHAAEILPLERATDERHHNLVDFGEAATGLCAAGETTSRILRVLKEMPGQRARITN